MWIFVKGIPEEMDSKALGRFIKRLLFPIWLPFGLNGSVTISGSKILKIAHTRTYSVEFHGLIQVLPANQVERVIRQINQTRAGGRQLYSHHYRRRFTCLDRRFTDFAEAPSPPEIDRVERRRNHLVSQVVDATM